jgi:hypothetical protein
MLFQSSAAVNSMGGGDIRTGGTADGGAGVGGW